MTDSIIVTLSQQTIKDRIGGYKKILEEWMASDGEMTWWYKMGNAPKREFIHVFWVIGGRIRFRSLGVIESGEKPIVFNGRTKAITAKNWLVCCDFKPVRPQIPMKGFQGFRYANSEDLDYGK